MAALTLTGTRGGPNGLAAAARQVEQSRPGRSRRHSSSDVEGSSHKTLRRGRANTWPRANYAPDRRIAGAAARCAVVELAAAVCLREAQVCQCARSLSHPGHLRLPIAIKPYRFRAIVLLLGSLPPERSRHRDSQQHRERPQLDKWAARRAFGRDSRDNYRLNLRLSRLSRHTNSPHRRTLAAVCRYTGLAQSGHAHAPKRAPRTSSLAAVAAPVVLVRDDSVNRTNLDDQERASKYIEEFVLLLLLLILLLLLFIIIIIKSSRSQSH